MATRFSSVAVETPREQSGELEQTLVEKVKWWSKKTSRDDCIGYNITAGTWSAHSLLAAPREESASAVVSVTKLPHRVLVVC